MKRATILVFVLLLITCCSPEQKEIQKYTVDGVEIIENQVKPYKIAGEENNLELEIEFTIDTEEDNIANLGVTDIHGFDVNDEGSIFIFTPPIKSEALVHKFDNEGTYLISFGKRGQGPGEIEYPSYQRITTDNKIPIVDGNRHKILIFDKHGNLLNEISFKGKIKHGSLLFGMIAPLANGNYLIRTLEGNVSRSNDGSQTGVDNVLSLYDSNFKWLGKDVDRIHHNHRLMTMRSTHMMPVYFWDVFDENIFIGNSQWGYEIRIFDLDGNLIKKIKKKYKPTKFSEEIINEFKRITENPESRYYGLKRNFPEYFPPFQRLFFTDDSGRLFVMTFEKGEKSNEHTIDIFNSEGVFIGKTSLNIYAERFTGNFPLYATAKGNRLYYLREKESGYKEIAVFRAYWK